MSNRNNTAANVAAFLALTGCLLVIFGCAFEAKSQLDLLRASGPAALDAYLEHVDSHQLSFAAFMLESVTGHCYAYGAFLQGVGFWFVFVFAPLSAALLIAVRWLDSRERDVNLRLHCAAAH
ncbi:hypothetical protein QYH69_22175 [Paraburkholderia sp. SARCC-3016]|uniref:hypothetical protein n=1 Tax=Paraburkholderia sp. SARCC-3016 TaxID=3058611 RepID=UPI002806AD3A|nr:hypothetical protein [Paraburkholderia sp. SARCC-3016]MDQ7979952.1 hypothetical protein [Paraburkholderia sp. SARCC-3016]